MKLRLALIAALCTCTGTAYAQPSDKFRSLDRNGDGFLSKDEVNHIRGYDRAFDEADDNRDGRISPDEFIKSESIHDRQQVGKVIDDGVLTANQGRVLLSGFVDTEDQKQRAVRVASQVEGVKEVRDGLNVR